MKSLSVCVKFDLTREALGAFPELAELARKEGAIRTSLAACTDLPGALSRARSLLLRAGTDYSAIKAPTLDGTEIWIAASALQEAFEKSAGFGRASIPLLVFKSERLRGLSAKNPIDGACATIELQDGVALQSGSGVEPVIPDPVSGEPADEILTRLEESGHLLSRAETQP